MRCYFLTAALSVLAAVTSSSAASIVLFENDAALVGDTTVPATSTDTNVNSTAFSNGPGLTPGGWPDSLAPLGFFGNASLADAIANDDYVTLTVTPDAGFAIDYAMLDLLIGVNVGTAAGENDLDLLSSATGFTAADSLATYQPVTATNGQLDTTAFSTDLSSVVALQGVTAPVEFRVYMTDIGNRVGIGRPFATDGATDFELSGTVTAIPEPSVGLLLSVGASCFLACRRR